MYVTFSQHHEFVYVSTLMNWSNAQKYCRERYTDLATTDNQADHDELLKTGGMAKFWLGLSRTRVTDVFVWSDQSSSSFTKWQSGQPNGQLCVNVEVGYWFDRNCVDNVPFACYFGELNFHFLHWNTILSYQCLDLVQILLLFSNMVICHWSLVQDFTLFWFCRNHTLVFQHCCVSHR